ncbi:tetratricopeptide repeat protein [Streptomyces sp. NPDC059489]|uniref:tetratricopeptide repeat protein n=1 Tax=Streptomyces sp. NPDC059489 TaxID=3346849 RepID=UPI0036C04DC9
MADLLLELGHLDLVVEAAGERGEWFCALAAVRDLCGAEDYERAWSVIEPFAVTGWKPAVTKAAEVRFRMGRVEEALALVRPDEPVTEGREWRDCALMMAKAGRLDEAIDALAPHLEDWWLQSTLVELTEGEDRDERVLELLAPLAQGGRQAAANGEWNHPGWQALDLQARVLERAGRVEEAIRLLGADVAGRRYLVRNTVESYAALLARHGRIEELRELGTGEHATAALEHYTKALEDLDRDHEAETVLREIIEATDHSNHRSTLVGLLARQGRIDEAVEVGRPTFEYYDCGNHLDWAVDLLVEDGRPEQALQLLEERSEEYLKENAYQVQSMRLSLLAEAGRHEEAIAEATALPAEEYWDRDTTIAYLLKGAGRVDEAVSLLQSSTESRAPLYLAELLIKQGRPAEAIAALPLPSVQRGQEARARRHTEPNPFD